METFTDTLVTLAVLVGLAVVLAGPALLGQRREWRVDRQLRAAERGAYAPVAERDRDTRRSATQAAIHVTPRTRPQPVNGADTCTAA